MLFEGSVALCKGRAVRGRSLLHANAATENDSNTARRISLVAREHHDIARHHHYTSYWQRDNSFVIPFTNIMTSLAIITTLVIVGMTVRYFCKRAAEIITRVSGLIGWVGVIAGFIIWLILYWKIFMMAPPLLYVTAMLLPSTGFIFAFLLAKLTCQNNKIARTIDIETSSQNMSVAISIILLSFTNIEIYKRFCKKQKIPTSTFKPTGTYLC